MHLINHLCQKSRCYIHYWPIRTNTLIFLSSLSPLASHTVGSNKAHTKNTLKWPFVGGMGTHNTVKMLNCPEINTWGGPYIPKGDCTCCSVLIFQLVCTMKWKNLFQGIIAIFVVIAPLHLPNPISVLNIMCALHRYGYNVDLHIKKIVF